MSHLPPCHVAFVASRNKPTLDTALFDIKKQARRRRGGGGGEGAPQIADRAAEAAREARLKGPHAFTAQRLLSIYTRISGSARPLEDEAVRGGWAGAEGERGIMQGQAARCCLRMALEGRNRAELIAQGRQARKEM